VVGRMGGRGLLQLEQCVCLCVYVCVVTSCMCMCVSVCVHSLLSLHTITVVDVVRWTHKHISER